MTGLFDSIEDFFAVLDEAGVNYLVLRNYENLLEPEIYVSGHGDIDLLCDDYRPIINLPGVRPAHRAESAPMGDRIHYCISVAGKRVSLDLRQVGDGYYCEKWEKELLERKVQHECFYVMTDEDYFYTLIYHAILQKRQFSDEYKNRLSEMAENLGVMIKSRDEKGFLEVLEQYMEEHGYVFTYSQDKLVPNRFGMVNKSMIQPDIRLKWKHRLFEWKVAVIEQLVEIKHKFENKS